MSYAAVTSHNALPLSQQPHPDTSLLNTEPPTTNNIVDDTSKVNLVSPSFKNEPATVTSTQEIIVDVEEDEEDLLPLPSSNSGRNTTRSFDKKAKRSGSKRLHEAEAEGAHLWDLTKHYLFRPAVAGGLVGLVNIGIFATVGRTFYTKPHLRSDARFISSSIAATIALFTVEGYAAEKYRLTPTGQHEERRAKKEGALIYKHLHEQILRPGVLGGIVGLVNTAVIGTVGYYSYINWDKPVWDRRTVSAVTVGVLTLWTGEGLLAERVRKDLN